MLARMLLWGLTRTDYINMGITLPWLPDFLTFGSASIYCLVLVIFNNGQGRASHCCGAVSLGGDSIQGRDYYP